MATKIFVNLPVRDLRRSVRFFTQLGFSFNPQVTDERAACMIVSDHIFVILMAYDTFKTLTQNAVCDATTYTEVLVCLSCESREKVDDMVRKAVAGGGKTYKEPHDHGLMYERGFQDLDGHMWEVVYMEPRQV